MALLEFTVLGPVVSHQTQNKANLRDWQARVLSAAQATWAGKPLLTGKLRCTIINLHEGEKPPCDDDNMVKGIRDALNKHVYADDKQIRYSETIQYSINHPVSIRGASAVILAAYRVGEEFVYFRLDDAPATIELPK